MRYLCGALARLGARRPSAAGQGAGAHFVGRIVGRGGPPNETLKHYQQVSFSVQCRRERYCPVSVVRVLCTLVAGPGRVNAGQDALGRAQRRPGTPTPSSMVMPTTGQRASGARAHLRSARPPPRLSGYPIAARAKCVRDFVPRRRISSTCRLTKVLSR